MDKFIEYVPILIYYLIGEFLMYIFILKKIDDDESNKKYDSLCFLIFIYFGTFLGAILWPIVVPLILLYKFIKKKY